MKEIKTITTVLPTHNRCEHLRKLLVHLSNQEPADYRLDIIVIDDGSTDGTSKMLKEDFPFVHVVEGSGNWWYTRSVNEGFKIADNKNADFVLTMNDDCEIESDYIKNLISAVDLKEEGSIIGSISFSTAQPRLLTFSGTRRIIKWRFKFINYHPPFLKIDPEELHGVHPSVLLPGRGMLIPMAVLRKLCYFDDNLLQYASDYDFVLRAQELGYKCYISWDARIYENVHTTGTGTPHLEESWPIFFRSYFLPHSKNSLAKTWRFCSRHGLKFLFPVTFIILILGFLKKKAQKKH